MKKGCIIDIIISLLLVGFAISMIYLSSLERKARCKQCDHIIESGVKYCPECGNKVTDSMIYYISDRDFKQRYNEDINGGNVSLGELLF